MSRSDRLTLLATFVRIAERGSLSAAARDLGTSQPSVSRRLAELEARLGAVLVRRSTHALALTPAGTALLADARRMLGEWEAIEERHAEGGGPLRGTVRVVAPVALGQLRLARAAVAFGLAHPGVSIEWRLTDEPIRLVEEGCDLWVRVGPVPDDTLVVREIARVERIVVAAPGLAEARGDAPLEAWPWIALGPFEGERIELTDGVGGRAFTTRPRLATDNVFALREAAMGGLGAAILPRWLVADALERGALVRVAPHLRAATLPVYLALAAGEARPQRVERLAGAIARAVSGLR